MVAVVLRKLDEGHDASPENPALQAEPAHSIANWRLDVRPIKAAKKTGNEPTERERVRAAIEKLVSESLLELRGSNCSSVTQKGNQVVARS